MATAYDIIRSALLLNGAVAADQTLSASDAADGLTALNDMIESWSLDDTIIYTLQPITSTTVANQDYVTLGTRPIRILSAQIRDSASIDHNMIEVGYDDYRQISNKVVQSYFPEIIYCDYAYPSATVKFWPVPAAAYVCTFTVHAPFAGFAALTDDVSFPPGYQRALRYNLALELAQYASATPQKVEDIAREALMLIKVANKRTTTLQNDPTHGGRSGRTNIYSNTF